MNVNAAGGSSLLAGGGMVGVGVAMVNAANKGQRDMAGQILSSQPSGNAGRVASESRGLMVDVYA